MSKPITKIQNLFSEYVDEQVVPASEYNGNIRALQGAIEHNGKILAEQDSAIKNLTADKLPEGSVTTHYIEDKAVTESKLSEDLQKHKLLNGDGLAAYFKDFLPTIIHKAHTYYEGTLFNGSIVKPNKKLIAKLNPKVSVSYGGQVVLEEEYKDEDGDIRTKNTRLSSDINKAAPETYSIDIVYDKLFYDVTCTWVTTIDLEREYHVGASDSDSFNFKWNYCSKHGNDRKYCEHADCTLTKIELQDNNNNIVKTVTTFDGLFKCTGRIYKDVYGYTYEDVSCYLDPKGSNESYNNVRYIKLYHEYIYHTPTSDSRPVKNLEKKQVFSTTPAYPKADVQLNKLANNTNASFSGSPHYNTTLVCPGTLSALTLSTYVTTVAALDAKEDLTLSVQCAGQVPENIAASQGLQVGAMLIDYIPQGTSDLFKVTALEEANKYYIEYTYQAPVIVTGIKNGVQQSYMKHDGAYIRVEDAPAIAESLGLSDVVYTPFSLGIDVVNVDFNSSLTDITINSIGVARYDISI